MIVFFVHCSIPRPYFSAWHTECSVNTPRNIEWMMHVRLCGGVLPAAHQEKQERPDPEPIIPPQAAGVEEDPAENHQPF